MFLHPFGLNCNACFGTLFVSILCTCCSHFSWYCHISFTIFCAPAFCLLRWLFSLSSFGQRFLSNVQCTNTGASHILFLTWSQLIFTYSLSLNKHWRDGAFVMLLTYLGMRQKSWKGFRMCSRDVSNTFTVAGRSVYLHKRTSLKEMKLKWLYSFVFVGNTVIPGIFWSYHVTSKGLTLILLTWKIRWAPNNASKWQMGFNSAFKVLR
jgi:hypothetical protein